MAVKIVLDQGALAALHERAARAALLAMEAVKTDLVSSQTMPFNQGNLQNGGTYTYTRKDRTTITGATVKGLTVEDVSNGEEIHVLLATDGPPGPATVLPPGI